MEINHQKLKILCYPNYINHLSWFDKRKNVVITNHESIFFFYSMRNKFMVNVKFRVTTSVKG